MRSIRLARSLPGPGRIAGIASRNDFGFTCQMIIIIIRLARASSGEADERCSGGLAGA
jgi:hypothetical protein